jgi:hypothetical protein
MHKPSPFQTIALLSVIWVAFVCMHTRANAQETSTFDVTASVISSTCVLKMYNADGISYGGTRSVNLPTANAPSGTGAGSPLGTAATVNFFLVPPSLSGACWDASEDTTPWNIVMSLDANQITTIGTKTYLTNAITVAQGGTDAVVMLKGGKLDRSLQELTLQAGRSTLINASGETAQVLAALQLQLQLTQAGTAAAKAGFWRQTIPLTITYN